MRPRVLVALFAAVLTLVAACHTTATQTDTAAPAARAADGDTPQMTPAQLFETSCSNCHSLDLPRSQRLNRATWEWVVSDMVNKYGATWLTEEEQTIIIDYLAENYGPDSS